jgi:hypothetical protein
MYASMVMNSYIEPLLDLLFANESTAAAQIVQSAPYVEARTSLQPSVDFFNRAVAAAERTNSLTGNLLTLVSCFDSLNLALFIN